MKIPAPASKVRRDLRVSLVLLVVGVFVFVVAEVAFAFQQHNTVGTALEQEVVVESAASFILIGAVFAVWNERLLRRSARPT